MSTRRSRLLTPIVILAVAAAAASAFYLSRPEPKKAELEIKPLLVDAALVHQQDIKISVQAQGSIRPRTATAVMAEVSGKVVEVSPALKAGNFFKHDSVLLRIDDRDYRADVKRAEAAVASAHSELASELGRSEVAYKDWLKYRSDVKRSNAANDLALRKPQLAHAQAKLEYAEADLDKSRTRLDRTVIRAPYDGLVRSTAVDIGQYVSAGSLLLETFAIDTAELHMALPENKLSYLELPGVHRDQRQTTRVDLIAEVGDQVHHWQGKLVRTEGVFDDRSRVLFAVAEIDDPYNLKQTPQHRDSTAADNDPLLLAASTPPATDTPRPPLRIGTFVEARIEGREFKNLVTLPRRILRAGNKIWIIDEQNRLQNRQVSVLRTEGAEIYVTQGLSNGERVCLSNIVGAVPGTEVSIASSKPTDLRQPSAPLPEPAAEQGTAATDGTSASPDSEGRSGRVDSAEVGDDRAA